LAATETSSDRARPWPGTRWTIDGAVWTVGALRRDRWESTVMATDAEGHVMHRPEETFIGAAAPANRE